MGRMKKPETIAKWLDEATLWIVETADHDFDYRHRMMCTAIDMASDYFKEEARKNGDKKHK